MRIDLQKPARFLAAFARRDPAASVYGEPIENRLGRLFGRARSALRRLRHRN